MKTHICPTYSYLSFNHLIVLSFVEFQYLFYYWIMNDCMKHFQRPFIDFAIYMYVYVYIYMQVHTYSFNIVAYIIKNFLFSVYMYISALYILFAPGSYTIHWLMFFVVNTTGNKAYLILSYLIWCGYIIIPELVTWYFILPNFSGLLHWHWVIARFSGASEWILNDLDKIPRFKPCQNTTNHELCAHFLWCKLRRRNLVRNVMALTHTRPVTR